jgi:ubiquitin-protein ligase
MDLEKAYHARGLPFERNYAGTEQWSDDEEENNARLQQEEEEARAKAKADDPYAFESDDDEENAKAKDNRNRKYVNSLAEENAKKMGISPAGANEMSYVSSPKYSAMKDQSGEKFELSVPLPYVSSHITKTLGQYAVRVVWDEFIAHGATDTACTQKQYIASIGVETTRRIGRPLPFDRLRLEVEDDDYVSFSEVVDQLSVMVNAPCDEYLEKDPPLRLPACCAFRACRKHRALKPGEEPEEPDDDLVAPFFLDQIYVRWKLEKAGNLRRKHVPAILVEASIPHNVKRLPPAYWSLYGDVLIGDSLQMMEVVDAIRVDMDQHREMKLDLFRLPRWLKNEFSISEIKLFIHHFKTIDVDCGGTIDAEELQLLTESLGSKVTLVESQELIDENDEDGSGTIDFEEFMILMFRIQHGTVDLENNKLGRAIMESKTQLSILQEIDELHRNPPIPQISVGKYGGCPVVCEYLVEGPPDTPYEGGLFKCNVRYNPGYPYGCPTVTIATRIYCINVMPKINGDGVLGHLVNLWDCNWDSRKLLMHFYELLQEQDYALIPTSLYNVSYAYFEQPELKEEDDASEGSSLADSKVNALKFPDLFDQLARIEQVQVNNIILHMGDRTRYNEIATQYTKDFARPPNKRKLSDLADCKDSTDEAEKKEDGVDAKYDDDADWAEEKK